MNTKESIEGTSIRVDTMDVTMQINAIMKKFNSQNARYQIALAGAPYVEQVYKSLAYPNKAGRDVHLFFGYKIARGNWQKSIQELSKRRKYLRDLGLSIVGPRYNNRGLKNAVTGSTDKNAAANYAHMIYGSARAYMQRITLNAVNKSAPMAIPAMEREALKLLNQAAGERSNTPAPNQLSLF